jgi:hypothetical protein
MEYFNDADIKKVGKIALILLFIIVTAIVVVEILMYFKIITPGTNQMTYPITRGEGF